MQWNALVPLLAVVLAACMATQAFAFQLTRPPSVTSSPRPRTSPLHQSSNPFNPPGSAAVSSTLISQLAVIALKLRLEEQLNVSCDVTSSPADLLTRGVVGPVSVKGKAWRSGLGLTCRAIEATVDTCELDLKLVLQKQKLVLKTPAMGSAMVALNSQDFANFITHPLMTPPSFKEVSEAASVIEFLREDTLVNPSTGTVTFSIRYAEVKWMCQLERGPSDKRALVKVAFVEQENRPEGVEENISTLTEVLSRFFNELVFELDGTYLSFRDMMVTDKGADASVMLALNIKVRKFPSPGLEF